MVNLPEQAAPEARAALLERLTVHENVELVVPNYRLQWIPNQPQSPLFDQPPANALDAASPEFEEVVGWGYNAIGTPAVKNIFGGSGVDMAFIDTGFDYYPDAAYGLHPDLGAVMLVNLTEQRLDNPCTDHNTQACYWEAPYHGTSVLATATAWENQMYGIGIAPDVRSVMVKPMYVSSSGAIQMYDADMAAAFDWVTQNRDLRMCFMTCTTLNIRIGNVSIGWPANNVAPGLTDAAFARAYNENVVAWMASAGDGDQTAYPARFGWGTVVTGVNESLEPTGPQDWYVDIAAPGTYWPVATNFDNPDDDGDGFWWDSGTSIASPAVAAVGALLFEANTWMTAATLKSTLLSTAYDLGPFGYDYGTGEGMVQADCAVLGSGCSTLNDVQDPPDEPCEGSGCLIDPF